MRLAFGMENENLLSDKHFGDSNFYSIYDLADDDKMEFVSKRTNPLIFETDDHEEHDPHKAKKVVALLSDCDVFVAHRMGPNFMKIKSNSDKFPVFASNRDFKITMKSLLVGLDIIKEHLLKRKETGELDMVRL